MNSQNFHFLDIPVFENGVQLDNPWTGGMNAPQWSSFDINKDGLKDLYAFDRNGHVHLSFINMEGGSGSTNYKYSRYWLSNFPPAVHYVMMRDYNRDGAVDMFTSSFDELITGFKVFRGSFVANKLEFDRIEFPEFIYDVIPYVENGVAVNFIEVFNNADYPAIDDLDGDGDLDILTMNISGSKAVYYKNIALESGFNDEVLLYEIMDDCWGKFGVTPFSQKFTLGPDPNTCAFGFADPTLDDRNGPHGGYTMCTFDNDNDGDKELLYGDLLYETLIFGTNGGNNQSAWISEQDTTFPSDNFPVNITEFPASYYLDVNNDGAKDLIVSPNKVDETPDIETAWFYQNSGTTEFPDFNLIKKDLLADNMLDFGTGANPVFTDVNADGLMDIVVGNKEEWAGGNGSTYLILILNTGTPDEPAYEVVDRDWLGFSEYYPQTYGLSPCFGDLDNDGDEDLLVGERFGFMHFLENIAGQDQPYEFAPIVFNWKNITVGNYSTPFIHDINDDELPDLIIGERNGTVNYLPNIGTASDPEFHPVPGESPNNENFGKINTQAGAVVGFSQPVVLEFNDDKYIFTGTNKGWLYEYKVNMDSIDGGAFDTLDLAFGNLREGFITRVAFANINGDNYLDAVVGNHRGGITIFQSPITVDGLVYDKEIKSENEFDFAVYPNPANDKLYVEYLGKNTMINSQCILYNSYGQLVMSGNIRQNDPILIDQLSGGVYFMKIKNGNHESVKKIIIK